LREIDPETALLLAERIRVSIEQTTIEHGETKFAATVSIGVAIIAEGDRDVQDMIERADQGLYIAKKTGRNRTFLMPAKERDARAA
jgi:diguanylate cyclase (GGDEF)-like protein